jgi:copper chaperone
MSESQSRAYTVRGMTCGHCRAAVMEEVSGVSGVADVDVDLDRGRLEVRGAGFTDEHVAAAVEAAGYEVVARANAT